MQRILLVFLILFQSSVLIGQSFEAMAGDKRIFIDTQYLKFFDETYKWSLFSRARATAAYNTKQSNLFTGAYLNYTTKSGLGPSVIGRIGSFSSGLDIGVHYFKSTDKLTLFALPSINVEDELLYSWFSIFRYTPTIKNSWKVYSSLELFTAFNKDGHASSVQRVRLGLDRLGYQFGFAANLSQLGRQDIVTDENLGVFLRKQF